MSCGEYFLPGILDYLFFGLYVVEEGLKLCLAAGKYNMELTVDTVCGSNTTYGGDKVVERVILIILDSVGIGALPDAEDYGDLGANTLGNIAREYDLKLPYLEELGLGKIEPLQGINGDMAARGVYGKMAEQSVGKDTTTGHWELSGIISESPFPTYPDGFPDEVIEPFCERIGRDILGNYPASGTEIIEELGREHLESGKPIVYTSADSVFQVAAHVDVISVDELYEICELARKILTGEHGVARVIARPFTGEPGSFERTEDRKDFSLAPPGETMLDKISQAGLAVQSVGKIDDIFVNRGITASAHRIDNMETVTALLEFLQSGESGLIFANLVEFDMVYGHRREPQGYARALEDFDARLPEIYREMKSGDVLFITADHGCDPTFRGTDHTREYVPLLGYGEYIKSNLCLETRDTFSDLAATITELLGTDSPPAGRSFAGQILEVK